MPQYKVTNTASIPVRMSWNFTLFNDEQLEAYKTYQQTEDYKGTDSDQISARKRLPESAKIREWANMRQLGVVVNVKNPATKLTEVEYQFELPALSTIVVNERQVQAFKPFAKQEIKQKLEVGQSSHKYITEGFVEIKEVGDEEVEATPTTSGKTDLSSMSYKEMQALAKEKGIPYVGVSSADLFNHLSELK